MGSNLAKETGFVKESGIVATSYLCFLVKYSNHSSKIRLDYCPTSSIKMDCESVQTRGFVWLHWPNHIEDFFFRKWIQEITIVSRIYQSRIWERKSTFTSSYEWPFSIYKAWKWDSTTSLIFLNHLIVSLSEEVISEIWLQYCLALAFL